MHYGLRLFLHTRCVSMSNTYRASSAGNARDTGDLYCIAPGACSCVPACGFQKFCGLRRFETGSCIDTAATDCKRNDCYHEHRLSSLRWQTFCTYDGMLSLLVNNVWYDLLVLRYSRIEMTTTRRSYLSSSLLSLDVVPLLYSLLSQSDSTSFLECSNESDEVNRWLVMFMTSTSAANTIQTLFCAYHCPAVRLSHIACLYLIWCLLHSISLIILQTWLNDWRSEATPRVSLFAFRSTCRVDLATIFRI